MRSGVEEGKNNPPVVFKEKPLILNQDVSESYISLDQNIESTHAIQSEKTLGQNHKTKAPSQTAPPPPKLATKIRFKRKEDKENISNGADSNRLKPSICTQTENPPG